MRRTNVARLSRVWTAVREYFSTGLRFVESLDAIRILVLGYLSYILMGWFLLCLPWCRQNPGASWLDHLFTSTSAVSTTGLVTVSTSDSYNWAGEFIVMLLIQFGGLGYMTISSFTVLAVSGGLSPLRERISGTALTLPQGFEIRSFLKVIFWFTIIIEGIGAAALYPSFVAQGAPRPMWQAIFHSVSAFCTAGFGLFNNSLEDYRADAWLNFVVTVLSYLGAIGFIVLHDVWKSLTHRKPHVTFTTQVILWSTVWIAAIGTVLFALQEPRIQPLSPTEHWLASLFQVMSASTTVGFNTIPIGPLSPASLFLLTIVMVIGASPSGTGGGLKTTTITALWAEMMSVVRRRQVTTFLGRQIPELRMRSAVASAMFYVLALSSGLYALALAERAALPDLMFEAASALGTVGLSRGITGALSPAGKWIIIWLMFVGRIGPLVLVMAFFQPAGNAASESEDIAV